MKKLKMNFPYKKNKDKRIATVTEREKTKDVEEFAGTLNKKDKDKVKDKSLLGETRMRPIDESDRMLTVKDLVEMMSIMMVSQKRLGNPNMVNIGEVSSLDMSMPVICNELEPEFDLKYDSLAKWCVFQGKLRAIEPFLDYELFV
jgi:hypothetical protein